MVVNEAGPGSRRWGGGCKALVGVLWQALAVLASPAGALTYTVTTSNDTVAADGDCSLHEAIQEANNGSDTDCGGSPSSFDDIIVFHPSVTTITLGSALPAIVSGQGRLTIDGGGSVTISGNNLYRVMEVNSSGADLTLRNLTVERGNASTGVSVLNPCTLTAVNSTLASNSASNGGGIRTGAGHGALENTIVAKSTGGGDPVGSLTRRPSQNDENLVESAGAGACRLANGFYRNKTLAADAPNEAGDHAPAGKHIEHGHFFGHAQRVIVQGQRVAENGNFRSLGAAHESGRHQVRGRHGAVRILVVFVDR